MIRKQIPREDIQIKMKKKHVTISSSENKNLLQAGNKPERKKKKHRFLKFILLTAVVILSYKGAQKICSHIAEDKLYKFADKYPFDFLNSDESIGYIYNDFTVPVSYEYNGKTYNVSWVSDSPYINIDDQGNATVKTPEKGTAALTLKQEYTFLIGKASLNYNANVISLTTQDSSEIEVIDKEEIINGTYSRKMLLQLDPENKNRVRYMDGDFGDLHINNAEDACTIAEAYKENLGIHQDITFGKASFDSSTLYTIYIIPAYYHGIPIDGNYLTITVLRESGEVTKINNSVTYSPEKLTENYGLYDTEGKIKEWNDKAGMISEPYIVYDEGWTFVSGNLVSKCIIYSSDGGIYEAEVTNDSVNVHPAAEWLFFPEEAQCSGKTEDNRTLKFPATLADFITGKEYRLEDVNRKIHVLDNKSLWFCCQEMLYSDDPGLLTGLGALSELYLGSKISVNIRSSTNEFNDPVAVETYTGLQNVYDYYAKNFNRYSYDGKSHTITALTDCTNVYDNASWASCGINAFFINPPQEYKYSCVFTPDVLAHEYTHAVFDSFSKKSNEESCEYKGINEAYADVLGCLAADTKNWTIGTNYLASDGTAFHIRDLLNFNETEEGFKILNNVSTRYKDELWEKDNGEEHTISVLISHIAAVMDQSPYFKRKDVANIWYNSMTLGYSTDATFLDARRNIIKSAEQLGFSKEKTDFIAYQFDLEEIFDPSYTITTDAFISGSEPSENNGSSIVNEGNAVEGDLIYDDKTNRNFISIVSPIGIDLFELPVFVLEDDINASDEEIEKAEALLTQNVTEILNDQGMSASVEIVQIPKPLMVLLTRITSRFEDDDFAETLKYGLIIHRDNTTPYKFYSYIGAI